MVWRWLRSGAKSDQRLLAIRYRRAVAVSAWRGAVVSLSVLPIALVVDHSVRSRTGLAATFSAAVNHWAAALPRSGRLLEQLRLNGALILWALALMLLAFCLWLVLTGRPRLVRRFVDESERGDLPLGCPLKRGVRGVIAAIGLVPIGLAAALASIVILRDLR